jgi:hypothetical protein
MSQGIVPTPWILAVQQLHQHGRRPDWALHLVCVEVADRDLDALRQFYSRLFGWWIELDRAAPIPYGLVHRRRSLPDRVAPGPTPGRRSDRRRAASTSAHWGNSLEPGSGIYHVASDHALPRLRPGAQRDHRLAGADADPHGQPESSVGSVQVLDRLQDAQGRPHRPLGVVFVRNGCTEHGHDGITERNRQILWIAGPA